MIKNRFIFSGYKDYDVSGVDCKVTREAEGYLQQVVGEYRNANPGNDVYLFGRIFGKKHFPPMEIMLSDTYTLEELHDSLVLFVDVFDDPRVNRDLWNLFNKIALQGRHFNINFVLCSQKGRFEWPYLQFFDSITICARHVSAHIINITLWRFFHHEKTPPRLCDETILRTSEKIYVFDREDSTNTILDY